MLYEQQRDWFHKEPLEAGFYARVFQLVLVQPFEFMRTCRQGGALLNDSQRVHLNRKVWNIIEQDQLRSLWRGVIPTMLRDVLASGIFWLGYSQLHPYVLGQQSEDEVDPFTDASNTQQLYFRSAAFCSATAAIAAFVSQPFDVVKTRMQVKERVQSDKEGYRRVRIARVSGTLFETYTMAGIRGLWTGGVARTLSGAVGGLLLGPMFEYASVLAADMQKPTRRPLVLGEDPSRTIVHPRSFHASYIEIK